MPSCLYAAAALAALAAVTGPAAASDDGCSGSTCAATQANSASGAFLARRKGLLDADAPQRTSVDRTPAPIDDPNKPLGSNVTVDEDGNPTKVEFSVSLSEITAATERSKKPEPGLIDLWAEGRVHSYQTGTTDNGNLSVLYLGTSSKIGSDVKVGALAQIDRGNETYDYRGGDMAATGWMAGPYMSMRLMPGLVFNSRAAWGTTENNAGGFGTREEVERRLLRGKLTGTHDVAGWQVAPSVGVVYLEDAVRDGDTGALKSEGTGKVEVLPQISRRFEDGDTYIEPKAAVGGFVGFNDLSQLNTSLVTEEELRLKAQAGVTYGIKEGSSVTATGGLESAGVAQPESFTGRLQFNMPLGGQ